MKRKEERVIRREGVRERIEKRDNETNGEETE